MVSDLLFSLREVEVKFGKKIIFQNLDVNLHKGDMIALVEFTRYQSELFKSKVF